MEAQPPARMQQGFQDVEKAKPGLSASEEREENSDNNRPSKLYTRYRTGIHLACWAIFTGWWVVGLVLHHQDKNWIVPLLLWLSITLRIISLHWSLSPLWKPIRWLWYRWVTCSVARIPDELRLPGASALVFAVIVITVFAEDTSRESSRPDRAISMLGFVILVFVLWITSHNRKQIKWQTVLVGILLQFILALFVLRTTPGFDIFAFISNLARDVLGFAGDGTAFLTDSTTATLGWFLITVVPPVIFFVALIQMLYHYHFIQWFVGEFAVFFWWSMGVSGAEAVAAAACPFIGQGENAILIKPFLPHLTRAEIHQVMCSGFGTIAGSVLLAYIGLGVNPQALISSCVMSIPASLAFSHLRYPEDTETLTAGKLVVPDDPDMKAVNGLHALTRGAWLGLKVAGMIVASVLTVVAVIGLINGILTWWGSYLNLAGNYALTINLVVGYLCYPVAFLLGVPRNHEILLVGRLIGIKIVANEFVAYTALVSEREYTAMSSRAQLIATYALCGFGNISALGIQIAVLSQIAPSRAGDVSKVAISALFTGILSTLSSASLAGMLVRN